MHPPSRSRIPAVPVPLPRPMGLPRPRRWSVTIVRVAGIEIRVHATFVLLLGLVAWSSAATGEPVAPALGWVAALFACVVVHELGHAFVARDLGVSVREIDLLPIGGMARLERLPTRWEDELRIAAAGPLTSIGVAAVLWVTARVLLIPVDGPDLFGGPFLARLVWANLLLAGFNLLPAFPMDGGRVFRALLQRRVGRVAATRIAVRSSRYLVWPFIVLGVLVDVWLLLIGVFLLVGGRAELVAVELHEALDDVPIAPLLRPCPLPIGAEVPADRALVSANGIDGPMPVVDRSGRLVGAVDAADLWRGRGRPVGEFARPSTTLDVGASAGDALDAGDDVVFATRGGALVGYLDPRRLRRVVERAAARMER